MSYGCGMKQLTEARPDWLDEALAEESGVWTRLDGILLLSYLYAKGVPDGRNHDRPLPR